MIIDKNLTKKQKQAIMTFENSKWKETRECIRQLKQCRTKEEYAMIFDINGFMEDEYIPECLKVLRNKIGF